MTARASELEFLEGGEPFVVYRSCPSGGYGPGVVVLHEGFGLDDYTRETADRLALAGFLALAPALQDTPPTRSPRAARAQLEGWKSELATHRVRAAIAALRCDVGCAGPRVGLVGSGIGGEIALALAPGHAPIGAVVDFGGLPDTPLEAGGEPPAHVLLVLGAQEDRASGDPLRSIVGRLRDGGCEVTIRRQPGVGADFASEAQIDRFEARAAAASWDVALAFLRAAL